MTLIIGEVRKLLTIRTALWFALASVVLAVLNVVIVSLASGTLDEVSEKEEALGGMPLLLLFFGVVAVTAEFRHHTAAPAVLVSGRSRGAVTAARLGATVLVGLGLAALTTGASFAVGVPILASHHPGPDLSTAQLISLAGGCVLAGTLSVLVGAALGGLLRNQIAAVVAGVVGYFVAPSLVGMVSTSAVDYTPFGSLQVLTRGVHGSAHSLPASALALAAWAVGLAVFAVLTERRRDLR
jgi:ABC-2 type transport system permease protein